MGMNVYGRNPDSEADRFVVANVLVWGEINCLNDALCSDLLGEAMLDQMNFHDGAGPDSQAVCTHMADRFEQWAEHNAGDERLPHVKQWIDFLRHCGGFEVW